MSKLAVPISALVLLAAPAIAVAKDKINPRTQDLLACGSVAPNEARLHCYDQAVLDLKQAVAQGDLVVNEKSQPKALEGVVKAAGPMGIMRYWVELDSGDRWQIVSSTMQEEAPRTGVKVKLRKGVFGNYWFSEPKSPDRRALYLGRRS